MGTTFGEELARATAASILVRVSETIRILASVLTARSSMSKDVSDVPLQPPLTQVQPRIIRKRYLLRRGSQRLQTQELVFVNGTADSFRKAPSVRR